MTACIKWQSSSIRSARVEKSRSRMVFVHSSKRWGAPARRAAWRVDVAANLWPSVDPIAFSLSLTIAMQSTKAQCSGGAIETPKLSPSLSEVCQTTKPLGTERAADPEPRRANLESDCSSRLRPAAVLAAKASAAKAEEEDAIPAPLGKLLSVVMRAFVLMLASWRTRSRKSDTR